jgi:hypothetical protein
MRPVTVTVGPLAAPSATNIRTASSISGAGAVTLNGSLVSDSVATLDTPRRVLFTSAGNDSGITFTVTGTTFANAPASEVVTGANASTVATVLDYKTVTSVVASGASAGNVSIGTNGVAGSPWVRLDEWSWPNAAVQVDVSGTVNYTVQSTLDDPNDPTNPVALASVNWVDSSDSNVVNATATKQSSYSYLPKYIRVLLNSQTNPGYVSATCLQAGSVSL